MEFDYFKLLGNEQEFWSIEIRNAGLAVIYPSGSDAAIGAFLFQQRFDFNDKVLRLFQELNLAPDQASCKLVLDENLSDWAQKSFAELKIGFNKIVERAAPFEIRYESKTKKVFVSAKISYLHSSAKKKIRTLIVDDSPTIRKILTKILSEDSDIEVVDAVGLPSEVEAAIEKYKPDVITLDIHLPEMNGVELLKKYLPKYRIPTVMISSISVEEGPLVLNALEAGAVDYIQKPSASDISVVSPLIILKIKTAASASLRTSSQNRPISAKVSFDGKVDFNRLIAIGSSTGGTEALKEIFVSLPQQIPPILVVQHIPAVFSKAFAERLNHLCPFEVLEGEHGMKVQSNRVIIAPGGKHMVLKKRGSEYQVYITDDAPVNRHKPSVDVLFHSVVETYGAEAIGVILTGMGADGAKGLLEMKKNGSYTIGQDEKSCVVYGMPQAAFKLGGTTDVFPLQEIAQQLMKKASINKKAV